MSGDMGGMEHTGVFGAFALVATSICNRGGEVHKALHTQNMIS